MELYQEILAHALRYGEVKITFGNPAMDVSKIVEGTCYQALQRIKAIIDDNSLDDPSCFMKIEEVVNTLQEIGSTGGFRHDFG